MCLPINHTKRETANHLLFGEPSPKQFVPELAGASGLAPSPCQGRDPAEGHPQLLDICRSCQGTLPLSAPLQMGCDKGKTGQG